MGLPLGLGVDLRHGRDSASKLTDRAQNLTAITKDNAEVFQVLISQVAKDQKINAVFSKASRVLGHAELSEPICNLSSSVHRQAPDIPGIGELRPYPTKPECSRSKWVSLCL